MDEKVILKNLTEQKLKAFAVGNMGKHNLSKKELEELRKKEQEEATAHVFQEFFNTFQDPAASSSKVWVKAGTYDAGSRKEDTKDKGKLYKPQSKISSNISENLTSAEKAQEYARLLAGDVKPERLGKKKEKDKKKSNLELFKEELRQIQEEREERHKYKGLVKALPDIDSDSSLKPEMGSFDNGDPNTTNLYLGNLNPKITEAQLMEIFGRYGPLASIKIMWPRSDEEKARGRNCGFVAFMNRKDGERALRNLNGKDILSYEMKLGWGKSVPIPPHPIYIPPALLNLSMPPPPSGLPFNAQPQEPLSDEALDTNDSHLLEKILHDSIVKVVTPTDRNLVALIHRMIEFVIREGPLFEAVIMNREINNPMFRFLFENQSPAHVYYRWKLYSMMQGDSTREWQTSDFRMFKGGSIWRPPPMNIYTQGMPEDLIVEDDEKEPCKGALSVAQRDRLEELLRYITPERKKIAEAMVFCIEHADAADEISECILEALSNISTDIRKKIARLYLISDILHNCSVKVNNASHYRRTIEKRLIDIMKQLHLAYNSIESRLTAEGFRVRVQQVFIAWEDWLIYPREFIFRLQGVFNGNEADNNENIVDTSAVSSETENKGTASTDGESDGIPLDEDVEGDDAKVWDGATLKGFLNRRNSNSNIMADIKVDERIDGAPLSPSEDPDGMPLTPPPPCLSKDEDKQSSTFIPSKWETVDPEQVEAQAMTTSKWDQLESIAKQEDKRSRDDDSDESSGELQSPSNKSGNTQTSSDKKTSEERRRRLREVELKAMTYQDELESGHRTLKSGWTVAQQVEHYRRKLIRKVDRKLEAESRDSLSSDVNGSNTVHDSRSSRYGGSSDKSDQSNRRKISPPEENDSYSSRGSRKYKRRSCSSSPSPSPPKVRHRPRSRTPISAKRSRTNRARSGTRSRSRSRSRSVDGVPLSPPTPPRIVRRSVSPPPRRSARYSPNSRSPSPRSPSPRSRHRRRVASPPTPPTPPRSSKHRARSPHDEKSSSRKYKHSRY